MGSVKYTTEQQLERWEEIHQIKNLMGRRAFLTLLIKDQRVFDEMWSKNEPCLGTNDGYYMGYEAVAGYFKALRDLALLKAELAKKANNEQLGDKKAEDLIGVGAAHFNNLSTPVIELAGDMKTAKGIWYLMDSDIDYGSSGYESIMKWGFLGVDFIKEDGQWKIWHMIYAEDINTPMGTDWSKPQPKPKKDAIFGDIENFKFPKPNVPMKVHEHCHEKRPLKEFPCVPQPYNTFSETFSYAVQGVQK